MPSKAYLLDEGVFSPFPQDKSVSVSRYDSSLEVRKDTVFSGGYKVIGTTSVAAFPDVMVSRQVVLFDRFTKRPSKQQVSDISGVYEFRNVAKGPWYVIAFDHTGEFNAVIADNIFGEPM